MPSGVVWQRSTYCATNACVAVLFDGPVVYIRSTRDSDPPIKVTRTEWAEFVAGVRAGEFDPADGAV